MKLPSQRDTYLGVLVAANRRTFANSLDSNPSKLASSSALNLLAGSDNTLSSDIVAIQSISSMKITVGARLYARSNRTYQDNSTWTHVSITHSNETIHLSTTYSNVFLRIASPFADQRAGRHVEKRTVAFRRGRSSQHRFTCLHVWASSSVCYFIVKDTWLSALYLYQVDHTAKCRSRGRNILGRIAGTSWGIRSPPLWQFYSGPTPSRRSTSHSNLSLWFPVHRPFTV